MESSINSYVSGSSSGPALAQAAGSVDVLYSTLALPPALGGAALECLDGSTVSVRNSIIVSTNAQPELDCDGATLSRSAFEMMVNDNLALGDVDVQWFDGFLAGNLGLSMMAPATLATAATWQTGDPATDIDGNARPTVDGAADYAGADVPN